MLDSERFMVGQLITSCIIKAKRSIQVSEESLNKAIETVHELEKLKGYVLIPHCQNCGALLPIGNKGGRCEPCKS